PPLAEIGQARVELSGFFRSHVHHRRPPIGLGGGIQEMFFQRDFFDHDVSSLLLRMIFSENRFPLFWIMRRLTIRYGRSFLFLPVPHFGLTCTMMQGGRSTARIE